MEKGLPPPVRVVILINFTLDYCIDRHPRHPTLKIKMNFYNPNPLHPLSTKNIEAKSLSLARMQDSWWQSVQSSESSIRDERLDRMNQ
jgi:hypothetical protein